jgi:hypothetical protein
MALSALISVSHRHTHTYSLPFASIPFPILPISFSLDFSLPLLPSPSLAYPFISFPLSQKILGSHEEIEELLESHLMDCNSLSEKLAYLMVTMQNAEDLVSAVCAVMCI